jgi:hypothetical protein
MKVVINKQLANKVSVKASAGMASAGMLERNWLEVFEPDLEAVTMLFLNLKALRIS